MATYCLTLQYQGTFFSGWQIQPQRRTVQGELNRALQKLSSSKEVSSLASGRTDAGVHALGQIVRISIPHSLPPQSLKKAINSHLPQDISVVEVLPCPDAFHPILHVKKKLYHYHFTFEPPPPPLRPLIAWCKHPLSLPLLEKGCALVSGRHDFQNFFTTGNPTPSTVRTLACSLDFIPADSFWSTFHKGGFLLAFEGHGFLKNMIRLLVGTLWSLGRRKITLNDLEEALKTPLTNRLGPMAAPHGLYLTKVFLKEESLPLSPSKPQDRPQIKEGGPSLFF